MQVLPENRRGVHWREKVERGEFSSPTIYGQVWAETLKKHVSELEAVLRLKSTEDYVLPWNRPECRGNAFGNMGKAIYTKLITLSLEEKIEIRFAQNAGRLAMQCADEGFMGITGFTIKEQGALDQGPDGYGEIHTVSWYKQNGKMLARKTIKHCWNSLGLDESRKTTEGRITYLFYTYLREKHLRVISSTKRKSRATTANDTGSTTANDTGNAPVSVISQTSIEEARAHKLMKMTQTAELHAEAKAAKLAKMAKAAKLRADAKELTTRVIQTNGEIHALSEKLERSEAESSNMVAKASALLTGASTENKRSEAAMLIRGSNAINKALADSNIHAKIFVLMDESKTIQASVDSLNERADEIDASLSLMMFASRV